jgi:Flp pilus assembly protein TadG
MTAPGDPFIGDRCGLAAVEFALVAPVLLLVLGGATDFGLIMSGKSQLANGIAQGVQYALLKGPSVSASAVQTIVQSGSSRAGISPTVSVTVVGPTCYCISGPPVALSASSALSSNYTCAGTCPVASTAPQAYLHIRASYNYEPLLPFYSQLASTTVTQAVIVKLQ